MLLEGLEKIVQEIKQVDIGHFLEQITERLEKMNEKWVIDRIEENTAICEERNTGKKKEIPKEQLPEGTKEGSVLKQVNGKYELDKEAQKEIEECITQKMNQLWKNER